MPKSKLKGMHEAGKLPANLKKPMDQMKEPDIDDLLEQLEEAHERGQYLTVEDVCAEYPDLLEPLRERWQKLIRFNEAYGTRRESTAEIERKVSAMPENMNGKHVVVQAKLQIHDFIDRGGLGDVYRAEDPDLGREVAIKLLRADRQTPANEEDFEREVKVLGGLVHPGIMSIFGAGETIDGREFYTMPYLDRGNLRASVMEYHALHRSQLDDTSKDFRDLLYRMVSACKTIAYAHNRGIVHRDLKTENVLLGKYGETFVIDWGCATKVKRGEKFKASGEGTLDLGSANESSSSSGLTLRYASPEQLHGNRDVGPESDIYGLGAMLYLLLTGSSPLEKTPDEEVRKAVIAGRVPPPESQKAGIPKRLAAICRKAMSTKPCDRYETALSLADDLERYLADETVSVCPDTWGVQLARIVRRNRTASLLLVSTLCIASALLSVLLFSNHKNRVRAEHTAAERLKIAATLTAKVGGSEIGRRFTLLEKAAGSPDLLTLIQASEKDSNALLGFLDDLKDQLYQEHDINCENVFITDAEGTQIARVPWKKSIGKNFAYRMYFHGGASDLPQDLPASDRPGPTNHVVLTRPYTSTNTNTDGNGEDKAIDHPIKVSFSVPIFKDPMDHESEVLGVLALSAKINQLRLFQDLADLSLDALALETADYAWGTGSAKGLLLDRHHANATPPIALQPGMTETEVKDAMLRLEPKIMQSLLAAIGDRDVGFCEDLLAPLVGSVPKDAAIARMKIPDRDLPNDWIVVFVESEAESTLTE